MIRYKPISPIFFWSMPIHNGQTLPPEEVANLLLEQTDSLKEPGNEPAFLLQMQIIDSLQTNSRQRRMYARRTFWLTASWIFLVILVVAASGVDIYIFGEKYRVLKLSDTVVITLLTTTTLNVFGFFLLVMKYLFNTEELKEMKDIFTRK